MTYFIKTENNMYIHHDPRTKQYFVGKRSGACLFYEDRARLFIENLVEPSMWLLESLEDALSRMSIHEMKDPVLRDITN